ncbi:MAG: DUF2330 domain-containing protein [Planctomycetota bacterium]|nr:DUF2330 domain-containing protein [Planctomycetota bacterium]
MKASHLLTCLVLCVVGATASADPCGMVPPVYLGDGPPIKRVGDQRTYVFYRNGVESIVIRPGFQGKVDNFGMLIPFPTPPAIRKVRDNIFDHVDAAIDPPEVVVDLRYRERFAGDVAMAAERKSVLRVTGKKREGVRVLSEEAVGMYQVAVLEAGSARALKKWMDQHGYQYPAGMDRACEDYVDAGWCFVAVKATVGVKSAADPRPGMRDVNTKLPAGAGFDGAVQAMGFRFRTDELVVPMRLSTFNEGDLNNLVYVLTDAPKRIRNIPETFVVRQLDGKTLFKNVTEPLPLRILGGWYDDIPRSRRQNLHNERNPAPRNGLARELFAGDLLAVRHGRLANPLEETEKDLARISERLGLRGEQMDAMHAHVQRARRRAAVKEVLDDLKGMTMTVVKGDFPRAVLARENLRFETFAMPAAMNSAAHFDAKRRGPGVKRGGVLIAGAPPMSRSLVLWLAFALVASLAGIVVVSRRQVQRAMVPAVIAITAVSVWAKDATTLNAIAVNDADFVKRGWAIVELAEQGHVGELAKLHQNNYPILVRTWAAAGRMQAAKTVDGLLALRNLASQFPPTARTMRLRLLKLLAESKGRLTAEDYLALTIRVPALTASLGPAILELGPDPLTRVMLESRDQNIRRRAAGYLAALAQRKNGRGVSEILVAALRFDVETAREPWSGGALFLPAFAWHKEDAKALTHELVKWHVWADRRGRQDLKRQLTNNLRSIQLARAAGYRMTGRDTTAWLLAWGRVAGRAAIEALLAEQGVRDLPRYQAVLQQLG